MITLPNADRLNLKDLDLEGLRKAMSERGLEAYRGEQVFRWVWRRRAQSIDAMTDLSKELREHLNRVARLPRLEPSETSVAEDGTTKLLVELEDGKQVESVLIPDRDRRTLCISTQVGCAMGCTFCATATMGLVRDLDPWEITEQVLIAERILAERGDMKTIQVGRGQGGRVDRRLTNLVFMGMGEPLHNLESTVTACKILTDTKGLAFPPRRITVSTVGLADKIEPFLERTGVNLAISLNAPDDYARNEIMPVNKRFNIQTLLDVVANLPLEGKRRVTFEYVLLAGFNDMRDQARSLAVKLRRVADKIKINLIPYNPHEGAEFERPDADAIAVFQEALLRGGVEKVHVRRPRGDDISAACGQLALKKSGAL